MTDLETNDEAKITAQIDMKLAKQTSHKFHQVENGIDKQPIKVNIDAAHSTHGWYGTTIILFPIRTFCILKWLLTQTYLHIQRINIHMIGLLCPLSFVNHIIKAVPKTAHY